MGPQRKPAAKDTITLPDGTQVRQKEGVGEGRGPNWATTVPPPGPALFCLGPRCSAYQRVEGDGDG